MGSDPSPLCVLGDTNNLNVWGGRVSQNARKLTKNIRMKAIFKHSKAITHLLSEWTAAFMDGLLYG